MSKNKNAANETETNVEPGSSTSLEDFGALVARHRNYFRAGATRPAEWRQSQLIALRSMMKDHAEEFYAALWADLRRNRLDADCRHSVRHCLQVARRSRSRYEDRQGLHQRLSDQKRLRVF